jgi:AraC family transcriptional regulator
MVGLESDGKLIHGFDEFIYPDNSWLVFEAKGKISENILEKTWEKIHKEYLPQSKYKQSDLPTIEIYKEWDQDKDFSYIEIRIPIEES